MDVTRIDRELEAAVLDAPIVGLNLHGTSLREELEERPTLLVFLRHFG